LRVATSWARIADFIALKAQIHPDAQDFLQLLRGFGDPFVGFVDPMLRFVDGSGCWSKAKVRSVSPER
jgi:hypothetical protein